MSLKQKSWTAAAVIGIGIVLVFVTKVLGVLAILTGFILDIALVKCPHCGTWLGKYPGDHCKNCGEKIDWNTPSA